MVYPITREQTSWQEKLWREPADVMCEIGRRIRQEDEREQLEYWSAERLQERGWQHGSGARVQLGGWERGRYTQRETGVLMKSTLRRLIEGGGSEQQPAPLLLC